MAKRQSARQRREVAPVEPSSAPETRELRVTAYHPPDGVPEIWIDGVAGVAIVNGIAKLRCFSAGTIPDSPETGMIVLRLAMGLPVLVAIHELLGRIVTDLRSAGTIQPVSPA